jgi:hypothetical protein
MGRARGGAAAVELCALPRILFSALLRGCCGALGGLFAVHLADRLLFDLRGGGHVDSPFGERSSKTKISTDRSGSKSACQAAPDLDTSVATPV